MPTTLQSSPKIWQTGRPLRCDAIRAKSLICSVYFLLKLRHKFPCILRKKTEIVQAREELRKWTDISFVLLKVKKARQLFLFSPADDFLRTIDHILREAYLPKRCFTGAGEITAKGATFFEPAFLIRDEHMSDFTKNRLLLAVYARTVHELSK